MKSNNMILNEKEKEENMLFLLRLEFGTNVSSQDTASTSSWFTLLRILEAIVLRAFEI